MILFVLLCLLIVSPFSVSAQVSHPYEGFGSGWSTRLPFEPYAVTNLNDDGPGSLRDALSFATGRYITFAVEGTIVLDGPLYVTGNSVVIDGLSAPGDGITLQGHGLIIRGPGWAATQAHDVIVQGIRIRDALIDGIQIAYEAYNVMISHCTISGSGDGNIDITEDAHDITVQWSILANPASEKNMLIKFNAGRITLHHNLFIGSATRNPNVSVDNSSTKASDTTVDIRNNLIRDWENGWGTVIQQGAQGNLVNNFYSSPASLPVDQRQAVIICNGDCGAPENIGYAYMEGNFSFDNLPFDLNDLGTVATPFPALPVETQDACVAAHNVLDSVGARPLADEDWLLIFSIALPDCAPGGHQTAYLQIMEPAEDDASEYLNGTMTLDWPYLKVGKNWRNGYRFVNVDIPNSADILSANLQLYNTKDPSRSISIRYQGELSPSATPFLTADDNLSTRPLTTAFVDDTPAAWVLDEYNDSPDLQTIVSEIVDQPGWTAGNAMALFTIDNGSAQERQVGTGESVPPHPAWLIVSYIP